MSGTKLGRFALISLGILSVNAHGQQTNSVTGEQSADRPRVGLVLSGGGALIPFLPELLQSKLSIPIEICNPLRNIEYDPDMFVEFQPEKVAPLLAVPIGLAARSI